MCSSDLDLLAGGAAPDLYLMARGDGADMIHEWDESCDTLRWLDVASSSIRVERHINDLVLAAGADRVRILNHFGHSASRVELFRFSDGVLWGVTDLLDHLWVGGATTGADRLGGYADMPNRIEALAGDDHLSGASLADWLCGGSGNDWIDAGAGNDTLIAEGGHDTLVGGAGDDDYRISRGGWQTTIRDYESTSDLPNGDVAQFTDLRSAEVQAVERYGNDLQLRFASGDGLRVQGFYTFSSTRIESFRFCDGVVWGEVDLLQRLVVGGATAGADRLGGFGAMANRIQGLAGDDTLIGAELSDRLLGGDGQDLLLGYAGNDELNGGSGNDRIEAGLGNDTLIAEGGHDTLVGGAGDDLYRISRGGWQTTIYDYEPTSDLANRDAVLFTNLRSSEVRSVERLVNDLQLRFASGDGLRVQGFYTFSSMRIESFRFCDGVVWGEEIGRAHV